MKQALASGPREIETGHAAARLVRYLSRAKFELAIFALLAATLVAIQFQDRLLGRSVVISPETIASYRIHTYDDRKDGGNSSVVQEAGNPLSWTCNLGEAYQYAYCGYEIYLDRQNPGHGLDLSKFETIRIRLSYEGSAEFVRLYAKNFDPRFSNLKDRDSAKFNKIEFFKRGGVQDVDLKISDFSVADWWVVNHKVPPELSQPDFRNIVAFEIQPGTGARPGAHKFKVESITLVGTAIPAAQWYRAIIGLWVVLISLFLIYRVAMLRRDFERRHQQQLAESRELQMAKNAAETASRAKSDFLAHMSHELRTPLNAILGYAQLLDQEDLSSRQSNAVRTIHQSGTHLLTLITDILDLAKIEAGKMELCPGPLDLRACVSAVSEMIRVRAEEKDLAFDCDVAEYVPRFVGADEKRLRQVLINLLGNAVKFTSDGRVGLSVQILSSGAGNARLRFEVRDTGPGIAAADVLAIFEPFEQGGTAAGRSAGTGLGLSISRRIVALMGGDINVETAPGAGSRFWFDLDLPVLDLAAAAPPSPAHPATGYRGERRRILIVDDTKANREVIAAQLAHLGFDTDEAVDGSDAVAKVEADVPDLILMDLRMPVMDGYEATRRIRGLPSCRELPIIAVSASTTSDVEQRSREAGASDFLAKPVSIDDLFLALARHLKLEALAPDSEAAPAAHEAADVPVPPQDRMETLLRLAMAGNMRALREEAERIAQADEIYRPFADQLTALAQNYQSPAILRLIQQHSNPRQAA